jgi:hypothetical protein
MRWYASATWPVSAYRWWMAYISGPFRLDEVLAAVDRGGSPGEDCWPGPVSAVAAMSSTLIGASSLVLGRMSAHRTIRWIFREPYARSPQT